VTRFRSKNDELAEPAPEPSGDEMLVIVDRVVDPYVVVFHDPTSYRAEQFRGLRNQLMALNPDGSAKTLVVTSAIKGEGKTISAVNLALAFAELDRHEVVLVDADLRDPSVESYLGLEPGPGLGDVLLERVRLESALRQGGVRNLTVLGAGSQLATPSEILTTTRIDDLFARLKERYAYVIVDTPPVLPATDASVIAARSDGTLLTVRLEYSTKNLTKEAIRSLKDLGANVLGVFVTEVRGADPDSDPRFSYRSRRES
jgi:capsular exopolysaccharide synthesis family protein